MVNVPCLDVGAKNLLKKIQRRRKLPPSISITNILQALYEESPAIKMYVDCIADGRPAPYTLITKTTDHEKNEQIVARLKATKKDIEKMSPERRDSETDYALDIVNECLDEAMILEEECYEVYMTHDGKIVPGSVQIVNGTKIKQLKEYAKYKGYELQVKKSYGLH